ncbi:MAG: hypothetical protein A2Z16_02695 [Chloroflexi bacterium RBG_16_54_18]|nr:MAG: hypothetical protein A2Z16_02695 [Chloroflexi bacterium RBG_16_54_18]
MISVNTSHLFVAAKSHAGMSGKNNEDRYTVTAYKVSQADPTPVVFALVSDGIGGHRAGETAAEIAVETISEDVAHSDSSHPVLTLKEAIIHASNSILAESETDGDKKGMGATCACVWVIGDQAYIATVGDSRIYLVRSETIQQVSIDHTWVQEAIGAGLLSPEEARSHPNAHVIRRYLGSPQTVEPDTRFKLNADEDDAQSEANQGMRLQPKDQILICSDGLTDLVNDNEILQALQSKDPDNSIDSLIELANQRGGHDNITIVVLGIPEAISQTKPLPGQLKPARRKRRLMLPCLITAFLILLLGTIGLGIGYVYLEYLRPAQTPDIATTVEGTIPSVTSPPVTITGIPNQTQPATPETVGTAEDTAPTVTLFPAVTSSP